MRSCLVMELCLSSRMQSVGDTDALLLQDGVLELFREVKDRGYGQKRDDELCFCWTKRSVTQR